MQEILVWALILFSLGEMSPVPPDDGIIEEIKARILKSLHLEEAPRAPLPLPTLQPLRNGTQLTEAPRTQTETEFLQAHVENISCNDQPCSKFHFDFHSPKDIHSAELWLCKKENVTSFEMSHTLSLNGAVESETSTTLVSNQTEMNGWIRFDISFLVRVENISSLQFQVTSENGEYCLETNGDKTPFLLLHQNVKSIAKRSASNCSNESSSCCKETFSVKFADIGWSDWIIQPSEYEANYCQGSCSGDLDLLSTHHARVLHALCHSNPQKAKLMGKSECVTCTPTSYGSVSFIYSDEQGLQVVSHLPEMTVKECGCA